MTDAVVKLLAKAKEQDNFSSNEELSNAVMALEALGDDASGDTVEYKTLKSLMSNSKTTVQIELTVCYGEFNPGTVDMPVKDAEKLIGMGLAKKAK